MDKLYHFIAGILIFAICYLRWESPAICYLATIIIGTLKELYDYNNYGKFDVMDLVFTVAGGAALHLLLKIILCN